MIQRTTAVKENSKESKLQSTKSRVTAVNVFVLKQFTADCQVPKNALIRQMIQDQRSKTLYISRDDD